MRTTLEIDDAVFRQAKRRAVERGRSLGQIVSEALRDSLREKEKDTEPFCMPVYGDPGENVSRAPAALAALRDEGR